jgi:hypothetical protein
MPLQEGDATFLGDEALPKLAAGRWPRIVFQPLLVYQNARFMEFFSAPGRRWVVRSD